MPEEKKEVKPEAKVDVVKMVDDAEQVSDIMGFGKEIKSSRTGKKFIVRPVSIKEIPKLVAEINKIPEFINKLAGKDASVELIYTEENLKILGNIISMSIDDMTPEKAMEEFSLGDFPKCMKVALDLNDFLAEMGMMFQKMK